MRRARLWLSAFVLATLAVILAGCDVDVFGLDARPIVGDYKLLVWEGGKYSLIRDTRDGCGVLGGTIRRIGWNDRVILAEQETCDGEGARSGWMVVNVKTHAIEGPLEPGSIRARPELASLEVTPAETAWNRLKWF